MVIKFDEVLNKYKEYFKTNKAQIFQINLKSETKEIQANKKITDAILLNNCKFTAVKYFLNDISRTNTTRNSC